MIPSGTGNQSVGAPPPAVSPLRAAQPSQGIAGARGINPMVQVATLDDIRAAETAPEPLDFQATDSVLGGHIRRAWDRNKIFKERTALRLLKCLRARRGMYSPGEIAQMQQNGGLNFVWVDLTETKCRAASAWIREVLLPVGERPWMLEPTPIPDLPDEVDQSIIAKAAGEAKAVMDRIFQTGAGVMSPEEFRTLAMELHDKLRDEVVRESEKVAGKRAERMSGRIADAMDEGFWENAVDEFIEDFVTYPTAILKGPFYARRKKLTWLPGFKPGVTNKAEQQWSRVDPFDAYPSPYARTPQDGDFIERVRFQRRELFDCIGMPGYDEQKIRQALLDYTNGHLEGWLWTEAERQRLQQDTMYTWLSPAGVIDALHYWGPVPGWKLMDWGIQNIDTIDPERDYEVDAILVGQYVIYCALNTDPLGRRPYWAASYDAVPGAFWGRSVPDLADTSQKMCNAAASALADNLGMASGPMIWVHTDRLADGESATDVYPWRVYQLKSDPSQGVNPGIGSIQFNPQIEAMQSVIEKWEIRADDATGIPRYTYGNERVGGAANTYSGLSMLMNNAAKGLRRAIGNIDINVIQQTVFSAYINEMVYGEDSTIKGDCFVSPRGAAALLVKEAQTQARISALQMSATPEDLQLLGAKTRLQLWREVFKALDIPTDHMPDDEELEAREEAAAEAQAAQAQAVQEAEARKEAAIGERELAVENLKQQGETQRAKDRNDTELKKVGATIAAQAAAKAAEPKGVALRRDQDGNIIGAERREVMQ